MPSAFTPNNDDANDVFRIPPNTSIDLKDFSVYDRWGNKVFYTTDIAHGWDGNSNGHKSLPGVYVYIIRANSENGSIILKGSVTLIR